MHRRAEEYGIEAHAVPVAWADVPAWGIFYDAGESLCPVMFYAQRHGVGKKLFEGVGRHCLQAFAVYAVHEFLESEHLRVNARSFQSLRRHHAGEEEPDDGGDQQACNSHRNRTEEYGPMEKLQDSDWNKDSESRRGAVDVGRFWIERVNSFLLERRHNIGADHGHCRV